MKAAETAVVVLIVFGLFIPVIITGCGPTSNSGSTSKYMNYSGPAFSDGTSYHGMWLNDELEYIVFVPSMVRLDSIVSVPWLTVEPKSEGLTICGEGLYYNGKCVDTSGMRKVFVVWEGHSLRPIEISQEHLSYLRLSNIQELEHSPVWLFFQKAIEGVPGPGVPESY